MIGIHAFRWLRRPAPAPCGVPAWCSRAAAHPRALGPPRYGGISWIGKAGSVGPGRYRTLGLPRPSTIPTSPQETLKNLKETWKIPKENERNLKDPERNPKRSPHPDHPKPSLTIPDHRAISAIYSRCWSVVDADSATLISKRLDVDSGRCSVMSTG